AGEGGGVRERGFGRGVEQVCGVLADVLGRRRLRREEERGRRGLTPSRTAGLLPRRGHGAGIAKEYGRLKRPDVEAELERVRGHDATDRAVSQPALDRAAL